MHPPLQAADLNGHQVARQRRCAALTTRFCNFSHKSYRWTLDALSGRFLTAVRFGRFKDFKEPLGADQKTQRGGQNAILVYIAHILQLQHPPHICT